MKYRDKKIDQFKSIWLSEEAYMILRDEKKMQKKSMAEIIDNLVKQFGEPFICSECKGRNFIKKIKLIGKNGWMSNKALCGDCGHGNSFSKRYNVFFSKVKVLESQSLRIENGEEIITEERGDEIRALKEKMFQKYGSNCMKCGITKDKAFRIELDHVMPVLFGGTDDEDNLQILCHDCNSQKQYSFKDYRLQRH